jgi:RNA-directed DNA polymerase
MHHSSQGGCASPLLANIALHGLEQAAAAVYPRLPGEDPRRRPVLVRYADDFVVLHHRRDAVEAAQATVTTFLATLGLQLHPTKTSITHTLHPYEGRVGFDFLGFTVRQYPGGKTHASATSHGGRRTWKTLITPSKEAIKRHDATLGALIRQYRGAPQAALITALNPRIRGWANYYRTAVASKTFARCDAHRYYHLWRWACWRHPMRGRHWIATRYWSFAPGRRWQFTVLHGDQRGLRLRNHTDTAIKRHVKVRGRASPYDGNLPYRAQRLKDHPLTASTLGRLLVQQQGKCAYCGLTFTGQSLIEIDHGVPTSQGGSDLLSNKQALHRHCHDQKHGDHPSPWGIGANDRMTEEPDEVSVSRPVLKGGGLRRRGPPT